MSWKKSLVEWLSFTRKDRIAILVIFFLVLSAWFFPKLVGGHSNSLVKNDTAWFTAMKKLEVAQSESEFNDKDNYFPQPYEPSPRRYYTQTSELFYFDPNDLSPADWEKLGLREKTIQTIQNYLNKGGRFKKPEDLKKVYGLSASLYERLEPYVRIKAIEKESSLSKNEYKATEKEIRNNTSIDINNSDTSAFIQLPGIGPKLAARIINFRDKLGGFYSIEQVAETFGLPDSVFQKIKPRLKLEEFIIRKININTVTVDELRSHPYFRSALANPIVAYRNEHGPFTKMEDIMKVMVVTVENYKKISPYISLQ